MVAAAVTKPVFCPTVATAWLLELQRHLVVTSRLGELSLGTPEALICRVAPGARVSPVGPIVMLVIVGVGKKPVQLTANASVASAAKVPTRRSLCFADDIVIRDSLGAPTGLSKIVAEKIPGRTRNLHFRASAEPPRLTSAPG
jgi:hypothetical protein